MRALPFAAAALLLACQPTGEIPLAMCPDDGSCFDGLDGSATPDFAPFDLFRPRPPRDLGIDAIADAMPDGTTDGTIDGMTDAMPDGTTDGMTDGTTDGMTDGMSDGTTDGMTDGTVDAADLGIPTRCADRALAECFGHPDCPAAERCENIATPELPVPCCVPGPRGELPAGADCSMVDGQIACASGVCIEDGATATCSTPCDDAADCPPSLPRCVAFPFGGTAFEWCFPE
ncbi:MAG: hypothetical protein H6705_13205 [Myxococcales bacterium]|nr:hypothetical protein [Myxococcales bacterium]